MTPDDRWASLSELARSYQHEIHEQYFQAGRFVVWLQRAVSQYLGCPLEVIFTYQYDSETEEFNGPVRAGWGAITKAIDDFWEYGMAIDIESAPNASPKLRPQWLVRIKPGTKQGENWFCQVGVGSERIIEIQSSSFNLDEVAEEILRA